MERMTERGKNRGIEGERVGIEGREREILYDLISSYETWMTFFIKIHYWFTKWSMVRF